MATYLGEDAGRRVLAGAIDRGVAETVRAVLWYSDLEGFTRIADEEPAAELMALLNDYAEAVVDSVHAHGGQVLKFIGDGILAMFPLADERHALRPGPGRGGVERWPRPDRLSGERAAERRPTTGMHVALHVGDVLYGNIGSRDRLDFTVVGPAVNEVARIEALCRSLEQQVIVSAAFARRAGEARARLVSLGRFALKGVRRPEELFTRRSGRVTAPDTAGSPRSIGAARSGCAAGRLKPPSQARPAPSKRCSVSSRASWPGRCAPR